MYFQELKHRLIVQLRSRIRGGETTERSLARMAGISQPHLHLVLKGKRLLSSDMADRIIHHLKMDLLDLLDPEDLASWRSRL